MKKMIVLLVLVMALAMLIVPVSAQPSTYTSGFQVQNLSDTDTATISISYYNQDGSLDGTPVSDTVAAGSSKTYFPIAASSGFDGSVVVSADQPVAAIANVLGDGGAFGASYGSFSSGAESVNMPLIMKNNGGFSTWFNVQNAGSADANVTVAYANTACTESATIKPGAAHRFAQGGNSCLGANYVGAATVTAGSGDSIVATGMQVGTTTLFAYNGFTSGSTELVIPLINANNGGFVTGFQLQNAGAASTDVTVSYEPLPGAGTACYETLTVAAGTSETFALNSFTYGGAPDSDCAVGAKFVGSAKVTANSGSQPLVGIINQLNLGANQGSAYNAFDPASATDSLVMPLLMDRNGGYYTGFNVQNVGNATTTITCDISGANGSDTVSGSVDAGGALNALQGGTIADKFVGSGTCSTNPSQPIIGVVNELGNSGSDTFLTYEAFNK